MLFNKCVYLVSLYSILSMLTSLLHAQSTDILNIYVDNQEKQHTPPDGSDKYLFKQLSDAFDALKDSVSPLSQVNIYVASSPDPYNLLKYNNTFDADKVGNVILTKWITDDQSQDKDSSASQSPVIDLTNSSLTFTGNMSLSFMDMSIVTSSSSLKLLNASLNLQTINMKANSDAGSALISVVDGQNITLNNINISTTGEGALLQYFGVVGHNEPSFKFDNILIKSDSNPQSTSKSNGKPDVLFKLYGHYKNLLGNVNITHLSVTSDDDSEAVVLQSLFHIDCFKKVFLTDFKLLSQKIDMASNVERVIAITNVDSVTLDQFDISQTNLSTTQELSSSLIFIEDIQNFSMTQVTLLGANITVHNQTSFTMILGFNIHNVRLSGNKFVGNTFNGSVTFFTFSKYLSVKAHLNEVEANIFINDLTITGNKRSRFSNQFTYFDFQDATVSTLVVNEVVFTDNNLAGKIFSIKSHKLNVMNDYSTKPLYLRNINFNNNEQASDITFFSFSLHEDEQGAISNCPRPIELYSLQIQNLKVLNNKFTNTPGLEARIAETGLLRISQSQVSINSSEISDNTFDSYSLLIMGVQPSSVIIYQSNFNRNELISSQFMSVTSQALDTFCSSTQSSSQLTIVPLYRYTFILDTTFEGNQLTLSSLLTLNNGFVVLRNNTIRHISLVNSQLFIATYAISSLGMKDQRYALDADLQKTIFGANSIVESVFIECQEKAAAYNPDNIYFFTVIKNTFDNVTMNDLNLLAISGFNLNQSLINVENNTFTQIKQNKTSYTSIGFNCQLFRSLAVYNNIFTGLSGERLMIFLLQSDSTSLMEFKKNLVHESSFAVFSKIIGNRLSEFSFEQNSVTNTNLYLSYVCLSIQIVTEVFRISDNFVNNTNLIVDSRACSDPLHGFWNIFCQRSLRQSYLLLSNNAFYNVVTSISNVVNPFLQTSLLIVQTQQTIFISNITLSTIEIKSQGSIMDISTPKSFYIKDSTFGDLESQDVEGRIKISALNTSIDNLSVDSTSSTKAGILFNLRTVSANTVFTVTNSTFSSYGSSVSQSLLSAAATTILSGNSLKLEIYQCFFKHPRTLVQLSNLYCKDCTIRNLTFSGSAQILSIKDVVGNISISDLKLSSSELGMDYLIKMVDSSAIVVMSDIDHDLNRNPLYLAQLNQGTFAVKDCMFKNVDTIFGTIGQTILTGILGDSRYPTHKSSLMPVVNVENVTFADFHESGGYNRFNPDYIKTPDLKIFPRSYGIIILASIPSNITIKNTIFCNSTEIQAVMVYSDPNRSESTDMTINIDNSTFKNISSRSGPLITLLPGVTPTSAVISNSIFQDIYGYIGSTVTTFEASLEIVNCTFTNNSAEIVGQDIYLGGKSNNTYKQTNTTFKDKLDNEINGVTYDAVDFNMSYHYNNIATGIQLKRSSFDTDNGYYNLSNVSITELTNGDGYFLLSFIGPDGLAAPELSTNKKIRVELDLRNTVEGRIKPDDDISNATQKRYSIRLELTNFMITGLGADHWKYVDLFYNSDRIKLRKRIQVTIRPCLAGEYNSSNMCLNCSAGTYSLDNSDRCFDCSQYMKCASRSKVCPVADYWNANDKTTTFYACIAGRCPNNKGCTTCAEGYQGPLCNACDFGNQYVRSGYLQCAKCSNIDSSLGISIGIGIALFIYELYSIWTLYSGDKYRWANGTHYLVERSVEQSYYIKTLLTFTQLMAILYMTNSDLYKSFGLVPQLGNTSALISYGTECSMLALGVDPDNFLYYQTLLITLVPILKVMIIAVITLILKAFGKTSNPWKIIGVATLYQIISNQPGIISNLGLFLSCRQLDGMDYKFVSSQPNWSCDSSRYSFYASYIATPTLIFNCVIVPVSLLVVFCIYRKKINTESIQIGFGMLLSDVKDTRYYWGIVLMILKLTISLMVFSLEQKNEVQVFISILVLWLYQSMVRILKPYKTKQFNRSEMILINLLMFNIVATEYLLSKSTGSTIRMISIVCGAILNILFLLFVLWKIFSLMVLNVVAFVEGRFMKRKISRDYKLMNSGQSDDLNNNHDHMM